VDGGKEGKITLSRVGVLTPGQPKKKRNNPSGQRPDKVSPWGSRKTPAANEDEPYRWRRGLFPGKADSP